MGERQESSYADTESSGRATPCASVEATLAGFAIEAKPPDAILVMLGGHGTVPMDPGLCQGAATTALESPLAAKTDGTANRSMAVKARETVEGAGRPLETVLTVSMGRGMRPRSRR